MKMKNKIKLGAAALIGGVATGFLLKGAINSMVKANLHRSGIQNPKSSVMSQKNRDDFANNPETILGQLFQATAPQITVTIPNREGRHMNALLYRQSNDNGKFAIVVHGYRSNVKSVSYIARRYFENGYSVLVPHLRAHKGSDYEYCTMGWLERLDIVDWANYLESQYNSTHTVLHGVSMGAATVMMTTGESLPSSVKCAIEDCGYTSVYDAYSFKIPKIMHLPAYPTVDICRHAIKKKVGFDIKEASALNAVRKSRTPILFLHGDSDTVVPSSMARELYSNATCDKDILIFPDTDHAMSPLTHSDKYWSRVWDFIADHE